MELGEANAREIANNCTVPREKIYYVLRRLEKQGMVRLVSRSPIRYVALQPKNTLKKKIDRLKKELGKIEEAVEFLEEKYSRGKVRIERKTLNFWEIVSGPEKRLRSIIEGCSANLDALLTVDESIRVAGELYDLLKKIERRNVEINVYSTLKDINMRALGRLSNVANVHVIGDEPWDHSIFIVDEEVGFILSNDLRDGIHFIDPRIAHIILNFISKIGESALDFRSLISLMDYDGEVQRLSDKIGKEPFYEILSGGLVDLIINGSSNDREEIIERLGKALLSKVGECVRVRDLSIHEAIDRIAAIALLVDDYDVDVVFNEDLGILTYELDGDRDNLIAKSVDSGLTFPPSLWSLLVQELIRDRGYKEEITTILYNKQLERWNFQKKFVKRKV